MDIYNEAFTMAIKEDENCVKTISSTNKFGFLMGYESNNLIMEVQYTKKGQIDNIKWSISEVTEEAIMTLRNKILYMAENHGLDRVLPKIFEEHNPISILTHYGLSNEKAFEYFIQSKSC